MKNSLSKALQTLALALLLAVTTIGFAPKAAAQDTDYSDMPEIRMFYPMYDAEYDELANSLTRPNDKYYLYFTTKVEYAIGNIKQNGVTLGKIRYQGATPATTVPAQVDQNPDLAKIQPGEFSIEVYEVKYLSGEEYKTYSDEANPIATPRYNYIGENGKIVSVSNLKNSTMKSYVPLTGNENVLSLTFDKPLREGKPTVMLEYGSNESNTQLVLVDYTLSNGNKTLTVDLRGKCYNVNYLAPGVTFYDDNGNITDPPTSISLNITNLECQDGSKIMSELTAPNGRVIYLTGSWQCGYNYVDLTFETPSISMVQFYNSSTPDNKTAYVNPNTDMMQFYVNGADKIASADVVFYYGNQTATVADAQIQKSGAFYTVVVPENVRLSDAENLAFGLENVTYTIEDGAEHNIARFSFNNLTREIASIADLKNVAVNEFVHLKVKEGVKVTLALPEMGLMCGEDATGGIQFVTMDYDMLFNQGDLVLGTIAGVYVGNSMFVVKPELCDFTVAMANTVIGNMVSSVEDINSGNYDNCLVTLVDSETLPLVWDPESSDYIMVGGTVPAVTDYAPEEISVPEVVENVTGVVYYKPGEDMRFIIIRSQDDINQELSDVPVVSRLADLKAQAPNTELMIRVKNAKVTFSHDEMGCYIIEDESGAILLGSDTGDAFDFAAGQAITGSIKGLYAGNQIFMADPSMCKTTAVDTDVTFGTVITPDQASNEENAYRLVTIHNTAEYPFTSDEIELDLGYNAHVVDYFGMLGEDYVFPTNVATVTGIVFPSTALPGDFMDDEPQMPIYIAPRSAADIVAAQAAVGDISGDGEVDSSDLAALINMITGADSIKDLADINGDGEVDSSDLAAIINIITGLIK